MVKLPFFTERIDCLIEVISEIDHVNPSDLRGKMPCVLILPSSAGIKDLLRFICRARGKEVHII
jgi:hypothetical protein